MVRELNFHFKLTAPPPPPPFGNTALTVKVKLSEVLDADGHWPVRTGMGMGTGGLAS